MNEENVEKIWTYMQEAGDKLVGKLPPSDYHPKGRNPYAHVALEIKTHFKMTYKDISDEKIDQVLEYIDYLKKNPS